MRTGQRTETGRVKVYRFRLHDVASDEFLILNRMATAACIRRIHAEPIKRTSMEIDRKTSMPME
jgi:predicted RNA-binding protein